MFGKTNVSLVGNMLAFESKMMPVYRSYSAAVV